MFNNRSIKSFVLLVLGILTLLILSACSSSAEKLNQDGNEAFVKEQFEEALVAYQSAQIENPELAEPYYNTANTLYRQGNYAGAMEQLQAALSFAEGESLAENSFYNLGNTFFNTQELETAIGAYTQALLLNPDDQEAKYNLELALQQQQQQEQEQQEQEQEQEQSEDGESQEDEQSEGSDQSESNQEQNQDGEPEQNENQGEGEPEQNDQGNQPNEAQDGEPDEGGQPGQVPAPGERMTEEQARQLLAAIAEDSDTLMERLEQIFFVRELPPVQDW